MSFYIQDCPIPFHDVEEAWCFITSLPPHLAMMFDGKKFFNRTLRFYSRGFTTFVGLVC